MIVCHCHAVREKDIREAISAGAHDLADIAESTGAGNSCQGCWPALQVLLAESPSSARGRQPVGVGAERRA